MHQFTNVVEMFLQYMESKERSSETISGYSKDLIAFYRYLVQKYNRKVYIENVTEADIEAFLFLLKIQGQKPASRSRKLYSLRSFFAYARKKEFVPKNIALSVDPPKLQQMERVYLSEGEVTELVEAIEHPLIRITVMTLYYTGLRISECLNLTISTVDLEKELILVVAGKGNKDRSVPISSKLLPILLDYIHNHRPKLDTDYFFATQKTGMLSPVYVNRVLGETVKKLGWKKKVTAHILRHSFASQLVKKNVNLVNIQKLLGHSSLKVTSIYTHSNIDELKDAVNEL
ncbi:tyrosine-type recombinase/integrase [Brevibacillus sp. AG]|uniref:tyrosine-type recombinase/integrase n=1 Tax=Brevibacillus sp. AG TaxID=3020891 RepID=UPI00232B526A|nr:tyrosine-type recombinase/integrase [Brevibacillus sp. AG]MDC0765257.1 tyrosine-type recombinase/integrase [Brevibacillus sp. AG]